MATRNRARPGSRAPNFVQRVKNDGVPKVLDFGIAKLLEPEGFPLTVAKTRTNSWFLTPEYASPEQIRGREITPSSDVYSLGVLLYRLLTGELPYRLQAAVPSEVERIVCHGRVPKPSDKKDSPLSSLSRSRRHDLDAIVMRSLRKEAPHRYASAGRLAADLRRALEGASVEARREQLKYRVSRWLDPRARSTCSPERSSRPMDAISISRFRNEKATSG